jgi:hypothetical protein
MSLREMLAGGGGVKSIQTGYVRSTTLATGVGEDERYVDVTVAGVNVSKSLVLVSGSAALGTLGFDGMYYSSVSSNGGVFVLFAKLTSATNIRIGTKVANNQTATSVAARWTVVEYK